MPDGEEFSSYPRDAAWQPPAYSFHSTQTKFCTRNPWSLLHFLFQPCAWSQPAFIPPPKVAGTSCPKSCLPCQKWGTQSIGKKGIEGKNQRFRNRHWSKTVSIHQATFSWHFPNKHSEPFTGTVTIAPSTPLPWWRTGSPSTAGNMVTSSSLNSCIKEQVIIMMLRWAHLSFSSNLFVKLSFTQ